MAPSFEQAAQPAHVRDNDALAPPGCGGSQIGVGVQILAVAQAAQLRIGEAAAQEEAEQRSWREQPITETGVGHGPDAELNTQGLGASPAEGFLDLLNKPVQHVCSSLLLSVAWPWRT